MRVAVLNPADCGDADAIKIGARLRRVALKIAVQRAVALRNSQLVVVLCEVVHADIQVSGFHKCQQAAAENLKLLHALGQVRHKRALLLFQPRHVCIAEHGDAVRREPYDLLHRVLETLGGLVGQAVDQVHVDAVESQFARVGDQVARHFIGLNPVHRFLHLGLEVLNAHAQPVEAHLAHRLQVRARGHTRIYLDPDLRVRRKREALPRVGEQVLDLLGGKIRRRSAAPVKLRHLALARNAMADVISLLFQHVQIRRRNSLVFLDDYVTRAEQAQAFAEGKMHVQRNGAALFLRRGQRCFVFFWSEGVGPHRCRGVAGVTGSRLVVAVHKLFAHGECIAHFPQVWIHHCHGASLLRNYERDFPAGCDCKNSACCPVWMNSCACSTGVCCKMP